jgi:drug/metabolite transporter (DMT)-like permease
MIKNILNTVSASFAETVKSAEPLSSVFLNYFYFKEASTTQTYLTLLPICMGVSISCMHDGTFGIVGFLCAFTSNFCFSSRAVLTKHLFRIRKEVASINEVCLFTHISNIGLLVLIPMTIMMEGSSIIKLFSSNLDITSWNLLLNFSVNGVAYSVYNLMSFLVLSRTDLVTHAVLNVFRRVFIIIFTSYYFVQYLSALNIFGIFLAVVGVVLFCFSRSKGSSTTNTMTEK